MFIPNSSDVDNNGRIVRSLEAYAHSEGSVDVIGVVTPIVRGGAQVV